MDQPTTSAAVTPPPTSGSASQALPVAQHYHLLTYPFHHPFAGQEAAEVEAALAGRWQHWWKRLGRDPDPRATGDQLIKTLDDSYFFLPHMRELLFPETGFIPPGAAVEQLHAADALEKSKDATLLSRLSAETVRRWTLERTILDEFRALTLRYGDESDGFQAAFQIEWLDMALFPQGSGFLVLKVAMDTPPKGKQLTVGRLNEFLYHLRILQPFKVGWTLATWNYDQQRFLGLELIDYLLQEVSLTNDGASPSQITRLDRYLQRSPAAERAPKRGHYTWTDFGQVYGAEFQVFSYVLLADNVPVPGGTITDLPGTPAPPALGFDTVTEQAIYELSTLTDLSDADFHPHPDAVARWRKECSVRLWTNWQGAFNDEHVLFVGLGKSDWTQGALSHNILSDYYPLYLLTLFQKMSISFLFPEVSHRKEDLTDMDQARELIANLLKFECRYWVTEVTRKPQGRLLYDTLQRALGVKTVFEELRSETEDIQRFYEASYQRRTSVVLLLLAVLGLPLGLLGAMFGPTVLAKTPGTLWLLLAQGRWPHVDQLLKTDEANAVAWLVLLLLPGVIFVIIWAYRRWRQRKRKMRRS